MTDNRLTTLKLRLGAVYETFAHDSTIVYSAAQAGGSVSVGLAVSPSGTDGQVTLAGDAEAILGELIKVEDDGYCTVQTHGVIRAKPGTGAATTVGKKVIGDLLVAAEGYVRDVAPGTAAELGLARGYLLTGTADSGGYVEVYLD